jgi:hypothetical protein
MLNEIKNKQILSNNKIIVGEIDDKIIEFLNEKKIKIHSHKIYLTAKGLSHLARDSKKIRGAGLTEDDILKIPHICKNPLNIYFDTQQKKLNLLYISKSQNERIIKIVIDTQSYDKRLGKITLIKTAGYIVEANLKNNFYLKIL